MKPDTRSFYARSVQGAIDHIVAHLDEALDLEMLASRACLSPFHFHRVFRGMVGETPVELGRRLRLERSAWQLANTAMPVTAIAFDAGYETHEAFTRAFRAFFSVPPSGFREIPRPRIELAATCGVHFGPSGRVQPFIPRDSGGRTMKVDIREMPDMRAATVHHTGPYNQIDKAFGKLGEIAGAAGLLGNRESQMIALYYDDPETTPADQLQSDAAITIAEDTPLPAGLGEARIAAGRYAVTKHVGPYEQLPDAWARFMGEWLPSSGHEMRDGVSYELYLNNPMDTAKDKLETELYIPVV